MLQVLESGLLVFLLASMMLLAVYQVVARNFFDVGITWGDAYVRVTVFWIAMVGALAASRNDEHIRIDIFSRILSEAWQKRVAHILNLLTSLLCFAAAWHSYEFVRYEYEDQVIAFAAVPAWICEAIMPLAMFLIALRYLGKGLGLSVSEVQPEQGMPN